MDSAIDDGDGKRRMRRALVKLLKEDKIVDAMIRMT